MKKITVILISAILLLFYLFSTSCSNRNQSLNDTKKIVDSTFNRLGISLIDSVYINDNSLIIEIQYIDNFYLTDESNELILSFLFYNLDNHLQNYESVIVRTLYKGLSDDETNIYKPTAINRMQNRFRNNALFKESFLQLIQNLDALEVISLNELIRDIKIAAPNLYEHQGGFWILVEDYTKTYVDTTSVPFISMNLLYKAAEFPERPIKPEVIKSFFNTCSEYEVR